MQPATRPDAVPVRFWAIAVVSLLWNSFGCYDFVMSVLRNPAYLAHASPQMVARIAAMPGWAIAIWAIGVWGSLAGSLLLLARSRHAFAAFAVSLAGLALSQIYQAMTGGATMFAMVLTIWAALLFFCWYAWRARVNGWLG